MRPARATVGALLAGIAMVVSAAPPGSMVRQVPETAPDRAPVEHSNRPAAAAPVIEELAVDVCVEPGAAVMIRGVRLAPQGKRRVVLAGAGVRVDLKILEWSDREVVGVVPEDAGLTPGQSYQVGIEEAPNRPWQGGREHSLEICGQSNEEMAIPAERAVPPARSDDGDDGGARGAPAAQRGDQPETGAAAQPPVDPFGSSTGASANYRSPALLTPGTEEEDRAVDAEPGQLLVWHADMDAARAFGEAVGAQGYRVRGRTTLPALGVVQTVIGLPDGIPHAEAMQSLAQRFPEAAIDANHRYRPLAEEDWMRSMVGWLPAAAACATATTVGLVDTDIDPDHPHLVSRDLVRRSVLPAGMPAAANTHGTAVAARLAGLLPRARLRAATVFRLREDDIVDTTAEWLLRALDWLAGEEVAVINLSLGGPANRLLALAVERLRERGTGLVAAVAEDGPESEPAYPAAYDGVIGVTAVDARLRLFDRARHGSEVDFAAPGVDVHLKGIPRYLTGTSHAAPFVTAALALAGDRRTLTAAAQDLGPPGRDNAFGEGLVRFDGLCAAR